MATAAITGSSSPHLPSETLSVFPEDGRILTREPLSRFRFRAEVDWVELEVRTTRRTQAFHLRKAGRGLISHAHGIDPKTNLKYPKHLSNTTTTAFALCIQAPERHADVERALEILSRLLDPLFEPRVLAIEVALDAYGGPGVSREELTRMTCRFLKGVNLVSELPPRLYRTKGETKFIESHHELARRLPEGFQIGIGHKDAGRFQHGYLKTDDNNEPLADESCRARIEIRLQHSGCPVKTLNELARFSFASLSTYFQFRQFVDHTTTFGSLIAERQLNHGNVLTSANELRPIKRKEGGTRRNQRGTRASVLNEIARLRLRKLTQRWRAPTGRGKAPRGKFACGNSDRLAPTTSPA